LENIFEEASSSKDVCDIPELDFVKRLSCFEEICPSDQDSKELNLVTGDGSKVGVNGLLIQDPNKLPEAGKKTNSDASNISEAYMGAEASQIENGDQKKSSTSSGMFGLVNRKGKNRKFKRVNTVGVAN
jgi:hypothetical protein